MDIGEYAWGLVSEMLRHVDCESIELGHVWLPRKHSSTRTAYVLLLSYHPVAKYSHF
jgi:hypothetical protein